MKEFIIGAVIGLLLIGYGLYTYYTQNQSNGFFIALIGAGVILIANYLSGRIFKQPVPKKVVQRIVNLVATSNNQEQNILIVPYSSRSVEQLPDSMINTLNSFVINTITENPGLGLAYSVKHQLIFVNAPAVRSVVKSRSTRMIVNDWYSFKGAIKSAGLRVIDLDNLIDAWMR